MKRRLLVICLVAVISATSIPKTTLTLTAAANDVDTETITIESTVETMEPENNFEEEQMLYATNTNSGSVIDSGACGDNATWELTKDGVLTISGSGAMQEYYSGVDDVPWTDHHYSISTVVIREGITSIGENTFSGHIYLKSIEIPSSIASIGKNAFKGCLALTSIRVDEKNLSYSSVDGVLYNKEQTHLILCPADETGTYIIHSSVTSIEEGAFHNCRELKSIEIPSSVSYIESGAFGECISLTSIRVDEKNLNYSSVDDVLYDKDQTRLICCSRGKTGTYIIPSSVASIEEYAFHGCEDLTNVVIPNSVTSIGYNAFGRCSGLTSIEIPGSVTSIGDWAFSNCSLLTNVEILDGVTSIGEDTFVWCDALTSIEIPNSVTSIGDAFYGCRGLTICGYRGSYAETYANENNIPFADISNAVTGISLSKTSTTLNVGANEILTVTISPANATNKNVIWTSSDTSVATINDGVVTAVAPGTAIITVTSDDGGKTASCTVTVEAVVNPNASKLVVSNAKGTAGDTVTVTVDLENNTGFASLYAYLTYSDDLTLVKTTNLVANLTFTSGASMLWDSVKNYGKDGGLLQLTFKIDKNAEAGECFVKIHVLEAFTIDYKEVAFTTIDGSVEVIDFIYGDANGDNVVNTKDIIMLRQYLAAKDPVTGISTVEIELGSDANGDGAVNTKDIIMLRQYLAAKDPITGESSVVLGPTA